MAVLQSGNAHVGSASPAAPSLPPELDGFLRWREDRQERTPGYTGVYFSQKLALCRGHCSESTEES